MAAGIITLFLLSPLALPVKTVSATPVEISAPQMSTIKLFANFNGFNNSRPSGKNPLLIVLSNSTLKIGNPPAPPKFTVNIQWSDSGLIQHNFVIVQSGGIDVICQADIVSSSSPTSSVTCALRTGLYDYYCEFHPVSMIGTLKAINPDVTHDGSVSLDDLIQTYLHEFTSDLTYDVNLDGAVSLDDLIIVYLDQFI